MNLTSTQLRAMLMQRYPSASIHLMDANYVVPKRSLLVDAYDSFVAWMWGMNLVAWVANKMDCDKWAWLFKSHVAIRNAVGTKDAALPVGFICYSVGGDFTKGHAINCAVYADEDKGLVITEIEPQPKNGLTEITTIERNTVWLVVI